MLKRFVFVASALAHRHLPAMRPVQMAIALHAPPLRKNQADATLRFVAVAFTLPGADAPAFPLQVTMAIAAPFGVTVAVPRIFLLPRRASRNGVSLPACDIARADRGPPGFQVFQLVHVQLVLLLPLPEVEQRPEHVQLLHVAVLVHQQPGPIPSFHREDAVELVCDGAVDVLHSGSPGSHQVRPRAEDLPEFLKHPVWQNGQPDSDVSRGGHELQLGSPSRTHELFQPGYFQRVPRFLEERLLGVAIEHLC